jgi:hypothetical protein
MWTHPLQWLQEPFWTVKLHQESEKSMLMVARGQYGHMVSAQLICSTLVYQGPTLSSCARALPPVPVATFKVGAMATVVFWSPDRTILYISVLGNKIHHPSPFTPWPLPGTALFSCPPSPLLTQPLPRTALFSCTANPSLSRSTASTCMLAHPVPCSPGLSCPAISLSLAQPSLLPNACLLTHPVCCLHVVNNKMRLMCTAFGQRGSVVGSRSRARARGREGKAEAVGGR